MQKEREEKKAKRRTETRLIMGREIHKKKN
jgi:hypothetical protein